MSSEQRSELVHVLQSAQGDFESLLDELGTPRLTDPGVVGDWSVKDILAHIAAWEERILVWAAALEQGTKPQPAWPQDWSEEQVNQAIYEKNRERTLQDVLDQWRRVYQDLMQVIDGMSDEELFTRKVSWLGGGSFAEAIPGNSYEHLRHHEGDIRAWLNVREGRADLA